MGIVPIMSPVAFRRLSILSLLASGMSVSLALEGCDKYRKGGGAGAVASVAAPEDDGYMIRSRSRNASSNTPSIRIEYLK